MKIKNNILKKVKFNKKERTILDRFIELNPSIELLIKKFNLEPIKSHKL